MARFILCRHGYAHDGTAKDWAIAIIGDAVVVRFGPMGSRLQEQKLARGTKPLSQEAEGELTRRQSEGYQILGIAVEQADSTLVVESSWQWDTPIPVNPAPPKDASSQEEPKTAPKSKFDAKLLVSYSLKAPSLQVLETGFALLPHLLPAIQITWVSIGKLRVPGVKGWALPLKHKGLGEVNSPGFLREGAPIEALLVLAALRGQQDIELEMTNRSDFLIEKIDEDAQLLADFHTNVAELRQLGAEQVGLIAKPVLFFAKALPSFGF
ncbi:MAG: hypothetical protein HQL38_01590 [Alphaproteobacteria bacterium]|nr:hypothetical protein [Alphaproteobacteria bacterium]